ncbi:hypothetical protein Tco_0283516, partial [Tanacetum coccineum]
MAITPSTLLIIFILVFNPETCPQSNSSLVNFTTQFVMLKPDNGIRPIAVGAIWRRLASKVAMRGVRKE